MTGTIHELNAQRRFGSIRANDGSLFTFYDSSVLAERFDVLRIGQLVSFEAGRGTQTHSAFRVQSSGIPVVSPPPSQTAIAPQLLYAGFDQPGSLRLYRFSAVARGEPTRHFIVSVDLGLFLKHRVALQEAPALCLRKLSRADLKATPGRHELTEGDLTAYVSDRAAIAARNLQRRRWHKPRRPTAAPVPAK